MKRPWEITHSDGPRTTRGPGHRDRETLIAILNSCALDQDHVSISEMFGDEPGPVLTPAVTEFLQTLLQCSIKTKGRRQPCGHSLCPACNRFQSKKSVQNSEGRRAWESVTHLDLRQGECHFLTINLADLPPQSPGFPGYAEHARTILRRRLAEYPGSAFTGQFEFNSRGNGTIRLGIHGWLLASLPDALAIRRDLALYFPAKNALQLGKMKSGNVQLEFTRAMSYSAKLPGVIHNIGNPDLRNLSGLIGIIDGFQRISSGQGRKGIRLEIGIKKQTPKTGSPVYCIRVPVEPTSGGIPAIMNLPSDNPLITPLKHPESTPSNTPDDVFQRALESIKIRSTQIDGVQ